MHLLRHRANRGRAAFATVTKLDALGSRQRRAACGFGDEPESTNFVNDGRGSGGFGGGFGGGGLGCLLPLIASRFGIGGVIVLVIGYFLLSSLGGLGGGSSGPAPSSQVAQSSSGGAVVDPKIQHFTLQVLHSTEVTWNRLLGGRYTPTTLHFYSESDQSGCGAAQSAMGPFYCPNDKAIYLDTAFFNELVAALPGAGRLRDGLCRCA